MSYPDPTITGVMNRKEFTRLYGWSIEELERHPDEYKRIWNDLDKDGLDADAIFEALREDSDYVE